MKYRSRLSIVHDILASLYDGPKRVSHLARDANLPVDRLNRILEALESDGMVRREGHLIHLTDRGRTAFLEIKKVKRILERLGIK